MPKAMLARGTSGAAVEALQKALIALGVNPGPVDGVFGPKTEAAVKDRLTKEITYWDHRAEELKLQEQAGRPNARLNSGEARKRADLLQGRLQKRLEQAASAADDLFNCLVQRAFKGEL